MVCRENSSNKRGGRHRVKTEADLKNSRFRRETKERNRIWEIERGRAGRLLVTFEGRTQRGRTGRQVCRERRLPWKKIGSEKKNLNLSLSYPLSTRTSDPDELSNKPQRHSRVSGVAKLISSSKTQSPIRKACTRLPSINLKANALSAFFCCFLNCLMSWCNVCHSKRRCLIRSSGV